MICVCIKCDQYTCSPSPYAESDIYIYMQMHSMCGIRTICMVSFVLCVWTGDISLDIYIYIYIHMLGINYHVYTMYTVSELYI